MKTLNISNIILNISGKTAEQSNPIIRPIQPEDVDSLLTMHQRLSKTSLYNRYQLHRFPTKEEIEKIADLHGQSGLVLVAALPGPKPEIVGLAYYVETAPNTAETALLIEDRYQGRGIGRRLMVALTREATAQNICFFDALVLSANRPMIHLLNQTGQIVRNEWGYGSLDMRVDICPENQ